MTLRAAPALLPVLALALAAPAARAETRTYRVLLGDREIGALTYEDAAGSASLSARFESTPLGVADGTFTATSGPATGDDGAVVNQYLSRSAFTRGARTISVVSDGTGILSSAIDPTGDATALSDPAAVPAGVLDLARGFGRIATSEGCPALRLYDGRRVAELATAASGEGLCQGRYTIVAGPGMLSPLSLTGFDMDLAYDGDALERLSIRTGPFSVTVTR